MVSAKFHIVGEDGEWFRVRVQEEIYAHGLEGSVLLAATRTLVVVVEGDKSRIKRLHSDMVEVCPNGITCTGLVFSIQRPQREFRIGQYGSHGSVPTLEYIMQILSEMERSMIRVNQKLDRLIALREGGSSGGVVSERKDTAIGEDATSGFASMFGD
ncbi:MAG: hypothetical protein V1744_03230 [Candidatus Altiarchaeota archaeon]